jgi:hypothetical protein
MSITKNHFDKKAKQSEKNRQSGGSNVVIDLNKKRLGRITKDYGYFKKGHEQYFSDTAWEIYQTAGVIEAVN